jgi:hypothetical protein
MAQSQDSFPNRLGEAIFALMGLPGASDQVVVERYDPSAWSLWDTAHEGAVVLVPTGVPCNLPVDLDKLVS